MAFRKSLTLLETLIKEVESLGGGGGGGHSHSAHAFSPAAASTSAADEKCPDEAWSPSVPVGHTDYTWGKGGRLGEPVPSQWPSGSSAAAPKAQPPAAKPQQQQHQQPQQKPQQQPQQQQKQPQQQQQQPQQQQKQPQQQQQQPKQPQQPKQAQAQGQGQNDQGKGKQPKQDQKKQPQQPQKDAKEVPDFYRLDIRVGKIKDAWIHPDADSLYVEYIDLGEPEPRQVVSGLRKFIPLEEFKGSDVCVIVNLKAVAMRGVTSYGMVLAASDKDRTKVELIKPPAGAPLGARIYLEGDEAVAFDYAPDDEVNIKGKNNIWQKVAPELLTDANRIATFKGKPLRVTAGSLAAPTLASSTIS